jgi:hypothetical protein
MPATLVPNEAIPKLAAQIDSPAMLRVLRHLQQTGFLLNGQATDQRTLDILRRLADLGLVDPGYDGPTAGKPFIWISNGNGERVLKHLEAQAPLGSTIELHPPGPHGPGVPVGKGAAGRADRRGSAAGTCPGLLAAGGGVATQPRQASLLAARSS